MSTPADGLPLTRQRLDAAPVEGVDFTWDECSHCDGSGRDPVEWDGRCIFCVSGEVKRWATDDDLDEETGP